MMNEHEKKAVRELLDSVNIVRGKTEELIQLQYVQRTLISYIQGVMDASDSVDKGDKYEY